MANMTSPKFSHIARPYALAAFETARDKQQLPTWKAVLNMASLIAQDPAVIKLLANPTLSSDTLLRLFQDVLSGHLNQEQENFLALLAQYDRLNLLPEIAELFHTYCANLENISSIRVVTAVQADEAFKQQLTQSLSKRTQQQVTLQCEVNPHILGGAIIYIGDKVIDGSVRGKLARLLEFSLR